MLSIETNMPLRRNRASVSPTFPGAAAVELFWQARRGTRRLIDTEHPHGPEEGCAHVSEDKHADDLETPIGASHHSAVVGHTFEQKQTTSFADVDQRFRFVSETLEVETREIPPGSDVPSQKLRLEPVLSDRRDLLKYPTVRFSFPKKLNGSMQINPRIPTAGIAVQEDGTLYLFHVHESVWVEDPNHESPVAILIPIYQKKVNCAAFDPTGQHVYAATDDGQLVGFDLSAVWKSILVNPTSTRPLPDVQPTFVIKMGSSSSWHLVVSRNGKFVVVNSADGTLRLYRTSECWETPENVKRPLWAFQDVVSKVRFASCDLSGDGEYVVGGANGGDHKYELYIWNTSTGDLMDKLTGPSVHLYSVTWHPTRAFVVAATSDGVVDIWGPRVNWTAFAPDFQALPMNVEYIEGEDELDVDKEGNYLVDRENASLTGETDSVPIDVVKVDPVPVFASDSEDEEEVFVFETKVRNLMAGRRVPRLLNLEE